AQAIEFREQQSGRITHRSYGVVRMLVLPGLKDLVGTGKVQVVEEIEPAIERSPAGIRIHISVRPVGQNQGAAEEPEPAESSQRGGGIYDRSHCHVSLDANPCYAYLTFAKRL